MPARPVAAPIPTGEPRLDAALRTGGWPRGALACLQGPIGVGATTLALRSLAACQATGGLVAYVDLEGSFDPATAAALGIDLQWLLVLRPWDAAEAMELAAWLTRSRLLDAFVLDLHGARTAPRALARLPQLLARSGSLALAVADPALHDSLGYAAGIRITLQRSGWLAVGRDLVGARVAAAVTRHRWALPGGRAELDVWFTEGRRIDALLRAGARLEPAPRALDARDALGAREALGDAEHPALQVLSA